MKNIFKIVGVTLLIFAFTLTSNAQIEAGKKIVGASSNLGLNSTSSGGNTSSTLQLNTGLGYLITKNIAAGINFGFSSVSSGGTSVNSINYGAFGRIYIQKFYPEFNIGKINYSNGFGGSNSSTYYGGGIGYAISLNDYISIDPKISYTKVNYTGASTNNFGVNIGFNLYF